MDREYKSLLTLMDDESDQAASLAMAELLRRDEKKLFTAPSYRISFTHHEFLDGR